jgi:hypothetical protein
MWALLIFAAIVFLFDQLAKELVHTRLPEPFCTRLVRIREVHHCEPIYHGAIFRALMLVIWCVAATAAVWLHSSRLSCKPGSQWRGWAARWGVQPEIYSVFFAKPDDGSNLRSRIIGLAIAIRR